MYTKYQKKINQKQTTKETSPEPPDLDKTKTSEIQLNHIHCESKDDESETENTKIINRLKIKSEYETPTESNYYRNY